MNKKIITLILAAFVFIACASANEENLYNQVFGEKLKRQTQILEVYEQGRFVGELETTFLKDKVKSFQKVDLLILFREILEEPAYKKLSSLTGPDIDPKDLPFVFTFDPSELVLRLEVPLESRKPKRISFAPSVTARTKAQALEPAPFSGAVTIRAEQTLSDERVQDDVFQSAFDSFLNLNSLVLENRSDYNSSQDLKWSRGDTRLVYDNEKTLVRYQAGDITNQVVGVQPFRQLGGLSISRNFALNPYRSNLPSGSQEFNLRTRSQVNTYINGALVKTEFLDPGRYSLDNLPLNNGLNKILIETIDELGAVEVFEFQQSSSLTLLNPGESRFDISLGYEYFEFEREREYQTDKPLVFSSFYQFGFSANKTAAAYVQTQGKFHLGGFEGTWATPYGLISGGLALGENDFEDGLYASLTYQLTTLGREWSDYHRLALTYDYTEESFQQSEELIKNRLSSQFRFQYSQPLSSIITANLGLNFSEIRGSTRGRYGYEIGLSSRLAQSISLSVLGSRNRDEFNNWTEQLFAFVTISFPTRGAYAQTLYNSQNQSTRLTVSNDSLNAINSFRTQASVERSSVKDEVQADVTYVAAFADLGVRGELANNRNDRQTDLESKKIRLRAASTLAFAADKYGSVFDITRPLNNSFAFLEPDDSFEEPLNVKGVRMVNEASLGPLGYTVYPNMIPYQYREIEVDASSLPEGVSLEKENFILYPRYRSGHLIRLVTTGEKAVSFILKDEDKNVLKLSVASLISPNGESSLFFTNKEGRAFIDGLSPGQYYVKSESQGRSELINIPSTNDVRVELGEIQLERGLK